MLKSIRSNVAMLAYSTGRVDSNSKNERPIVFRAVKPPNSVGSGPLMGACMICNVSRLVKSPNSVTNVPVSSGISSNEKSSAERDKRIKKCMIGMAWSGRDAYPLETKCTYRALSTLQFRLECFHSVSWYSKLSRHGVRTWLFPREWFLLNLC